MKKTRVIVGLSGGVDSAVSAWLLKQQGYDVQGFFMKNWDEQDHLSPCTTTQDLQDVYSVCQTIGIHFHTANFAAEYWKEVFTPFLAEYRANRTPNPDILCNQLIKFKAFLNYAKDLGADYIATGHYAHTVYRDKKWVLQMAKDINKDQTYFLHTLNQLQLKNTKFPLAHITKEQVRALAKKIGLINHAKKDSVGICFIGARQFKQFLQHYLPPVSGLIQTVKGMTVGEHEGLMYYTIGQRQGLKIDRQKGSRTEPWYVVEKESANNLLRVVQGINHPLLYKKNVWLDSIHWIAGTPPTLPLRCKARVRYQHALAACWITLQLKDKQGYHIRFESAQRAITSGQSIVFYQKNDCIGGGIIQQATY